MLDPTPAPQNTIRATPEQEVEVEEVEETKTVETTTATI
jgi:hypothetical protein